MLADQLINVIENQSPVLIAGSKEEDIMVKFKEMWRISNSNNQIEITLFKSKKIRWLYDAVKWQLKIGPRVKRKLWNNEIPGQDNLNREICIPTLFETHLSEIIA